MIQRIQTLYLIISIALLGLLYLFPLADILVGERLYEYTIRGIHENGEPVFDGMLLAGFLALIVVLHLLALLGYKRRIRQIRILVFTLVLLLGFTGVLVYFAHAGFRGEVVSLKLPVGLPLLAMVTDYLAIRSIGRDEALIRSLNRIR